MKSSRLRKPERRRSVNNMGAVKEFYFSLIEDEALNPSCPNCGSKDVTGEGKLCPNCWQEVKDDKIRHEAEMYAYDKVAAVC
jgi:hypothetical protein